LYDFTNLSDVEFEKLCTDILSRKLGVKLRYFAPGRDGGIDLANDSVPKEIIVQVKHYAKSSTSSLLASLEKEIPKVESLKPKQYYICVSKQLTAHNIKNIYQLFKNYMKDTSNIITRDQLVDFLNHESNQDILRKNFKLWLLSDRLLKDIFNNHVFIDGEVLLEEINDEFKYFVQTKIFEEALGVLRHSRVLMLLGAPGVGKSITSKMLAASFVKDGYLIRYTTNGEVSSIKNVISKNPDTKEVILLDDCLGQYYFNLKEGQDRELISLMRYINQHKNKVLILNTRVTIFNEAKTSQFEFRRQLEKKKLPLKTINMETVSSEEKAHIFYNHLLKNKIPKEYYDSLVKCNRHKDIIRHKNYNPRIIEFVTEEFRYNKVSPKNYYEFILKNLNNPNDVWAEEIEYRLNDVDRIFLHTLFSLTDTYIDVNVLEECFIHRLNEEGLSRSTINLFSKVKSRLTKSLIRVLDDNGSIKVGVLNPSINDYLNNHLRIDNKIALNSIKHSILYIEQLERMCEEEETEKIIVDKLKSEEFAKLKSIGNKKIAYLFYAVTKFNITNKCYKDIIKDSFNKLDQNLSCFNKNLEKEDLVIKFLEEPSLYEFYDIGENLEQDDFIYNFTSNIDYKVLSKMLLLAKNRENTLPEVVEHLSLYLLYNLDDYLSELDVYDYIEKFDGFKPFYRLYGSMESQYSQYGEENDERQFNLEFQYLLATIRKDIKEEIRKDLNQTIGYDTLEGQIEQMIEENISENKLMNVLDGFFDPEPDYDPYDYIDEDYKQVSGSRENDKIDIIFNREYIEFD